MNVFKVIANYFKKSKKDTVKYNEDFFLDNINRMVKIGGIFFNQWPGLLDDFKSLLKTEEQKKIAVNLKKAATKAEYYSQKLQNIIESNDLEQIRENFEVYYNMCRLYFFILSELIRKLFGSDKRVKKNRIEII